MELSPEERKRRSDLAKKLAEEGKIGGKQKGAGRPKKERAQEQVAKKIRDEGDAIFRALKSALSSDSGATKLKAALAMLDIEMREVDYKAKEIQRVYDNLDRQQMLDLARERIALLKERGINFDHESEAEDVTDQKLIPQ